MFRPNYRLRGRFSDRLFQSVSLRRFATPSSGLSLPAPRFSCMTPGLQSEPRVTLPDADLRPGVAGKVVDYPKPPLAGTNAQADSNRRKAITEETLASVMLAADDLANIEIPQRESICGTWFRQGDLGFIYAERGLGKTWLALYLARCLSEGRNIGPWAVKQRRKVLLVDGEMALDSVRERDASLRHGSGDFYVLSHSWLFEKAGCILNLSNVATQLALFQLCINHHFDLLILDNLSCLFSGMAENDADSWEQVLPWLLDLRRHKIAVIVIHHSNRSGLHMRGTSKREDAAFWVLRLDGVPDHSRDTEGARFGSRFTKARQGTRDEIEPLEWDFQSDGQSTRVTFRRVPTSEVFKQWIRDGLTSCSEIAEEMGISKGQVSKMAKRGEREGWLRIEGRSYRLAEGS